MLLLQFAERQVTKQVRSFRYPAAVFLIVFCVVLSGATYARHASARRSAPTTAPTSVPSWREVARGGHAVGGVAPKVTVVLFADYQCAGCALLHPMLQTAQRLMGEELRVVTRYFPLSAHTHAVAAANAAECAAEQGRFAQMEDVLYAEQDSIGARSWTAFAIRAGVRDTVMFAACVKQSRFDATVKGDREAAMALKLKGTPSYIVNGELRFGAPALAVLLQQLHDAVSSANLVSLDSAHASVPVAKGRERKWLTSLTLEQTITGDAGDELLLPGSIATNAVGNIITFDYGAMEVRAFGRNGKALWRVGRKGGGPGEFRNVMDLKLRSNGEIAVLDMANRRITTLSSSGKLKRTLPIKVSASRFVPSADTNSFTLAGDDSLTLWSNVALDGRLKSRMLMPASLVASSGIAREQFTAPLGPRSVMAYRWSDKLLVLAPDGAVQSIIDGVEPVTLPGVKKYPLKSGRFSGAVSRVDPKAVPGALSVATNGHSIFVLFSGATEMRGRIVDVYDAEQGEYRGSYLLPVSSQEIAILPDGAIVTLRMEPVPALDVWAASSLTNAQADSNSNRASRMAVNASSPRAAK